MQLKNPFVLEGYYSDTIYDLSDKVEKNRSEQAPITIRIVDEKENDLFEPWEAIVKPGETILIKIETNIFSRITKE